MQHCDRPSDFDPGRTGFHILLGRLPPDRVTARLALASGAGGLATFRAEWELDPAALAAAGGVIPESYTFADSASAAFGPP